MVITPAHQEFADPTEILRIAGTLGARVLYLVALQETHPTRARIFGHTDTFTLHLVGPTMPGYVRTKSCFRTVERTVPAGAFVLSFHTVFTTSAGARAYAEEMNRLYGLRA